MAEVFVPMQLADGAGNPTGRWHYVSFSDEEPEDRRVFHKLVDRDFGSAEEAEADPEVRDILAKRFGREPNFPGYKNPAGTTPGQRKGFTPEQIALIERARQARRDFVQLLHDAGGTTQETHGSRFGGADLMLSFRHMEDAEYRAIKHITGGPT